MNKSPFGYATALRVIGLLLVLPLFPSDISAQPVRGLFYHLTTSNGLSSNRITGIMQDKKGYYWIATQDGLNRFDGSACKVYRTIRNDSNSLSDNNCVGDLLQDDFGRIWVGTQHGVSVFDPKQSKFHRYYLDNPTTTAERANWIRGMTKDRNGNIYICSYGLWIYNIHTNQWRRYIHDKQDKAYTPEGFLFSPIFDSVRNVVWVKSTSGVGYFEEQASTFFGHAHNPQNRSIFNDRVDGSTMVMTRNQEIWNYDPVHHSLLCYSIPQNSEKEFASGRISDVIQLAADDKSRIWITHFRSATMIFTPEENLIDTNFLANYHSRSAITSLSGLFLVDGNGNYWLGSRSGISIYDSKSTAVIYYPLNPGGASAENHALQVNCMAENSGGILWIGTNLGLYRFDPAGGHLVKMEKIFGQDDFIRSLYLQADSILWIGGQNDLAWFDTRRHRMVKQEHVGCAVQSFLARDNKIWVGTWTKGLYIYSIDGIQEKHYQKGAETAPEASIFSNNLLCLSGPPGKSHFWVGYNGGSGYSRVNRNPEKFEHFRIRTNTTDDVQNVVNCIFEDKNGDVWIGTYGSGLARYLSRTGTYVVYSQNEGLSGNYINTIQEDDSSRIWITTNNGLDIFDTQRQAFVNTDLDLDQPDNDLRPNSIVRNNRNLLFFAKNHLIELTPDSFPRSSGPAFLLMNTFRIFDREILLPDSAGTKPIRLTHDQNFFSFEYSLLKPNPEGHVHYAYKLEGFDPDWNFVNDRGLSKYTNVPPGNYSFLVKAKDPSGRWAHFMNPVMISISPPFWNTWWFISAMVLMAVALIYGLFWYRINQVRRVYQLRSDISKDLHDQIGATLTSISYLSEVAKNKENPAELVSGTLDRIGQYSRDMITEMNDIVWIINPLNDSSDKLADRIRNFGLVLSAAKGIGFNFTTDKGLENIFLTMKQRKNLFLILKESINNAVKHSRCSEIVVTLDADNGRLCTRIRDNGVGLAEMQIQHAGNGLRNIRQRAEEIGGSLDISSVPGQYTEVVLHMPITHNAY